MPRCSLLYSDWRLMKNVQLLPNSPNQQTGILQLQIGNQNVCHQIVYFPRKNMIHTSYLTKYSLHTPVTTPPFRTGGASSQPSGSQVCCGGSRSNSFWAACRKDLWAKNEMARRFLEKFYTRDALKIYTRDALKICTRDALNICFRDALNICFRVLLKCCFRDVLKCLFHANRKDGHCPRILEDKKPYMIGGSWAALTNLKKKLQ